MLNSVMYLYTNAFTSEDAMLFCLGSNSTVLAFAQLSSISMSLHELHLDTAAAQGPDRPFALSTFLCLISVVAGVAGISL